jgi:hypothetical protein
MPVRKKIANNSASDNDLEPCRSNFSRGRSFNGQSVIAMLYNIVENLMVLPSLDVHMQGDYLKLG